MKARFSETDDSLTSGVLLQLEGDARDQLVLAAWMPASNQPDETSVTWSACFRSTGWPQAETNAPSMANAAIVVRRIIER